MSVAYMHDLSENLSYIDLKSIQTYNSSDQVKLSPAYSELSHLLCCSPQEVSYLAQSKLNSQPKRMGKLHITTLGFKLSTLACLSSLSRSATIHQLAFSPLWQIKVIHIFSFTPLLPITCHHLSPSNVLAILHNIHIFVTARLLRVRVTPRLGLIERWSQSPRIQKEFCFACNLENVSCVAIRKMQ